MSKTQPTTADSLIPDFSSPAAVKYRRLRDLKDVATRYLMAFGGISVILAILLIALYLLYVVLPMFRPAQIEMMSEYELPGRSAAETVYYAMEEQREIGMRITQDGVVVFFRTNDGSLVHEKPLVTNIPADITAYGFGDPAQHTFSLGFSNGSVLLAQPQYKVTYPDDQRLITPSLWFPLGEQALQIDGNGKAINLVAGQSDGEEITIAALTEENRIVLANFIREESMLSDEVEIIRTDGIIEVDGEIKHLILDVDQRELYFSDADGFIYYYDVSDKSAPRLVQRVTAVPEDVQITSLEFLSGGISILVGDSRGRVAQWFPVRDIDNNYTLEKVRFFDSQNSAITTIAPEYFRKGFIAADEQGHLALYHTTAHRTVKLEKISDNAIESIAISPRANAAIVEAKQSGRLQYWHIDNEHPEVSWQSIWGKVWYESRDKPEYIWQSSSASSDFEPKFSLSPLLFGTFKAAFYAMMFAIPMAILGAMYTAYFMSKQMRSMVKPTIEIMEALPTVILGFLAGLWFAPFVEGNMPGLFLFVFLLPFAILASAYGWRSLPSSVRHVIPEGWEAAMLIPVVIVTCAISFSLSQPIEIWLFGGNMPLWITDEMGISYDQRNSLVVGIAMGFAVIPTIFSISEDAVYSVPKHLTTGSLALGATTWQTMIRVVLLTASPGIFSAIMIGLGRAVGETMIVVMATGNTAIMDMNIFEGFRALSANIAVEMPESEVDSTHYRILFLAGLVLFIATFFFNTIAEVIRQRLRVKYSNL